jgi:hypothetical protein
MHSYFTTVSIIAGICLGFGILYLFIGLRRKDNKSLNLTFAFGIHLPMLLILYRSTVLTRFLLLEHLLPSFGTFPFIRISNRGFSYGCCPLPL